MIFKFSEGTGQLAQPPQGKVEYKARSILETLYSMRYIELSSLRRCRASDAGLTCLLTLRRKRCGGALGRECAPSIVPLMPYLRFLFLGGGAWAWSVAGRRRRYIMIAGQETCGAGELGTMSGISPYHLQKDDFYRESFSCGRVEYLRPL